MKQRLSSIYEAVAKQLCVKRTREKSSEQVVATMFHPLLQQQWQDYLINEHKNAYGLEVPTLEKIVQDLCNKFMKARSNWKFLSHDYSQKRLKNFVTKACELCWLMVLNKPKELTFYPANDFKQFVNSTKRSQYDVKHFKERDIPGSNSRIVYFSFPDIRIKKYRNGMYQAP
jgi:hypothetical protein